MVSDKKKRRPVPVFDPDPEIGLTPEQVRLRAEAGWSNRVRDKAKLSLWQIIGRHCFTFFNMVFVVMAVLLLLSGSTVKNLTFLVVVIINTVIGIVQQVRATRAVEKLTIVTAQKLPVRRQGAWQILPTDRLVRDDIVEFSPGDQLCADGVLRTGRLYVNEALVTGEEEAILKEAGDPLLSGSFVVAGRGAAQLTAVGEDAFAARLAAEAKKDPKVARSEMMSALDKLIRAVAFGLIPVGLMLFFQDLAAQGLRRSAETTVAALVGMIPEGLYLLTTLALAASVLKLAKKKVLAQDMNCIETLARVDVLCVDKTGTITEPKMAAEALIPLQGASADRVALVLAAMYGAREPDNETGRAIGEKYGAGPGWDCRRYIPFTSERKWCAGEFEGEGAFVVGAPQALLGDGVTLPEQAQLPPNGRVLLVAGYRGSPEEAALDRQRVQPMALLALSNPVRQSAGETFAYFADQGVTVKVITGDDPESAAWVARQAGIPDADRWVDTGSLETEADFLVAAERYTVFGRVTPQKKRSLIRALKAAGHTVAMTGDGVNDVLAMKEADCAVAMASGARAASQVAQLVLLESDFSAMPHIVGEGRRVINNIQRAASLFLVKNIFALGTSLISLLSPLSYPMEPLHMSIISGFTIGIPSFFLAMEPNYERIRGKFLPQVLRKALPGGLTNILVILAAQIAIALFALPEGDMSSVCTALLAVVGMTVLWRVCRPFDTFRRAVWFAMAAVLLLCFTLLRGFLELQIGTWQALAVLGSLLVPAPAVLLLMSWLCDLLWRHARRKKAEAVPPAQRK